MVKQFFLFFRVNHSTIQQFNQNSEGESIGIVALGILREEKLVVHIYHLGAFVTNIGNGSIILSELCHSADKFNIQLSISAVSMSNGKDRMMDSEKLKLWYGRFGFKGESGLLRQPKIKL